VTWVSSYELDPFAVPEADRVGRLTELSERLLAADGVDHVDASVMQVLENKFYADTAGTMTTQQRVRIHPELTAVHVDRGAGAFYSMRTLAPPAGRGWEYLTGTGWDFDAELAELPELLREHAKAPSVEPGRYDLVIDPSNLWLTIHESVGHTTELDRALGWEANYAGTSFATPDKLGTLRYGSPLMNITGDRSQPGGLATVAFDDDGVRCAGAEFPIIAGGVFRNYQMAIGQAALIGRAGSNGCAYAESPTAFPLQRMPNVSLEPNPKQTSLEDLFAGVDDGIYVVGDGSWSIDQQRYNFQFGGQLFYEIKNGKRGAMLRDVAYQGRTPDFWNAMDGLGDASTRFVGGSFMCGKGQPAQIAPVSHGAVPARFRQINVLNTERRDI